MDSKPANHNLQIINRNESSHPKYRPDIDGLRTIAIGLVVAYHFFPNYMPGGFTGVDVFFVISGYLISTIIMNQMAQGSWSYTGFYTRRINRIFPALGVVLGFNLLLGWYALVPNEFHALGKHVAASAGFVANLAFWSEAGYFDAAAETKPLLHMWSMAIEEQFYIIWPLLLALTVKVFTLRRAARDFLWVIGSLTCASLAYSVYIAAIDPDVAYYSPFSRFFELAIGGLLAWMIRQGLSLSVVAANISAFAGVSLIAAGAVLIMDTSPFPGFWALLPTLGTAALIFAGPGT